MEFEWGHEKSHANNTRRGFDFAIALDVFAGRVVEVEDARREYGEVRIRAIGKTGSSILAIIYTDRNRVRRIISVRVANKKERAWWLGS